MLAQPLFATLNWVHGLVGNWGWAIIIVTALIKLLFYPLSQASGRSMAKMRTVAPRMKQIQETFKDDREKLGRAMMELYKKEKINPLAGCLPMLVQIPFFISFYRVLLESVEMRQAPFLLWVNDLSSRDPYFVLPLLMGAAMFAQFKLNPAPPDPMQAKIMQFMPLVMTGMMAWFPCGLVLYWLTNTLLTIAQQWRVNQVVEAEAAKLRDVNSPDTIAAVASAPGRGAVGVIRVSGPLVPRIAIGILGVLPAPRHARLSSFLDAEGSSLDAGLALYFPAPASYTGEDVLELQGHGGALIVDLVLRRLLELGCRMARPGEFSERAFLNGKIDIAQAEAIADLIDAGTAAAARAAVRSMQGEFSACIADLKSRITNLRAYVEAAIDFPDEEIDFLSAASAARAARGGLQPLRVDRGGGAPRRLAARRFARRDRRLAQRRKIQLDESPRGRRRRHRHRCARHDPRRAAPAGASRRLAFELGGYRRPARRARCSGGRGRAACAQRNRARRSRALCRGCGHRRRFAIVGRAARATAARDSGHAGVQQNRSQRHARAAR